VGLVDEALARQNLSRNVAMSVANFLGNVLHLLMIRLH